MRDLGICKQMEKNMIYKCSKIVVLSVKYENNYVRIQIKRNTILNSFKYQINRLSGMK